MRHFLLPLLGLSLLVGCEPEPGCTTPTAFNFDPEAGIDNGTCENNITQAQLDDTPYLYVGGITGDTFAGPELTIPHILTEDIMDPDSTERGIWTNHPNLKEAIRTRSIPVGTIIVKRIWYRDPTETAPPPAGRGQRRNTYVMVKRPPKYYPAGGDWEYIAIPYDPAINFATNPNALLSFAPAGLRGRVALCSSCHNKSGDDFLFGDVGDGSSY
ncbi:MAG: cytochrome P460 family protein [Bacteroidia bacterium]|nr:cytochrome P460 family protein [Bacteroidia bacterium]